MPGFVTAVAVAATLAVVSRLTLSTPSAIAHDFYANWLKQGKVDSKQKFIVVRVTTIVIGILAIGLWILAQGVNVAVLVIFAICVAVCGNLPVLMLSLFWRHFSTDGLIGGIGVGRVSSVAPAMIGPVERGADAFWPRVNPTVVSLPLGFLGACLGTMIYGRDAANETRSDDFSPQVHTGNTENRNANVLRPAQWQKYRSID